MSVRIRPYRDSDLDRVLDIAVAAWEPVFGSFHELLGNDLYGSVFPEWESMKRREVAAVCRGDNGRLAWVAEEDGEIAGFVSLNLNRETLIGEIEDNAVDPPHQNRGIGALMYAYVLDRMKEEGMKCAVVSTGGDSSHAPARRAYEKAGFTRLIPSIRYYQAI